MDPSEMKILLVVGTGGFTHAAPVLELGRILHARGYQIEFATHQGQEKWVESPYYSFIKKVYTMGPDMDPEFEDRHYLQMQQSDIRKDMKRSFAGKVTVDLFWKDDYAHLKNQVIPECRPNFIVADFFADAVKDINIQLGIPFCHVWPQMPYGFCPSPFIPGMPGFQIDALTSEHASLWTRLRAAFRPIRALPALIDWMWLMRQMRRTSGVYYTLPMFKKPDYLILVNSFWGLETPKDLPPLVAAVGPVLPEEYPPLDEELFEFYKTHRRVVYVAFGTHIRILPVDLTKFMKALSASLQAGHIDGVVWAANAAQMKLFDRDEDLVVSKTNSKVGELLDGKHPSWKFVPFAPQRAVLDHPHTVLFVTHGGGSSANEALYHGTAMLVLGFYFDQILNALRLTEAEVALALDKADFSLNELRAKLTQLLLDHDGSVTRNVLRMQKIAQVSSRKKEYGADLIEETLWDHHYSLREDDSSRKMRSRPMHLQTADMRMSWWKANNWDLTFVGVLGAAAVVGLGGAVRTLSVSGKLHSIC
ncbi:glycosyltransferase family 1 protein [Xylona heveae TC161]|uniref:Glycosyltransferase family 1 protein n=1 Tax=Xylona heveae (strain CBS 132557 / TC161) TaxID=1328760 RepID=A0A165II13_XYLHT|nr:glycosyltransferase family 1 protein [Xylona heveae TC161]KZF24929.1 glycosyltransferase family 1 protein [Xylona heveae TC161]